MILNRLLMFQGYLLISLNMQNGLSIQREQSFKGYNDTVPPEILPSQYLADALNAYVTRNKIEKRTGYTIVGDDTGSKAILGLQGINTGSLKRLYRFKNKSDNSAIVIEEYTGSGSWTTVNDTLLTNVSHEVNCVVAENVVYAYDGASVPAKITPGSPSTAAAVPDANHPRGSFGSWFHNFHFVAGTVANRSRIKWSELEDSDDFTNTTTGYIDVNPDDGDYITGMGQLNDRLIIFKRKSVWALSGFGTGSFTLDDLGESVSGLGTPSHRSIINMNGNFLAFINHTGDLPEFRLLERTRYGTIVAGSVLSSDIRGTMATINTAQLGLVAGNYDGRRLRMAVPVDSATRNNLVLVYDDVNRGWVRHTGINASCWAEFDFSNVSEIYFGESQADSKAYKLDSSTSDNGTAIAFSINTKRYGGERPEVKKKWKYLYVTVETSGSYNLTVNESPDGFSYDLLDTISLASPGAVFPITLDSDRLGDSEIRRRRLEFGKKTSYYEDIQFIQNGLNETVTIRDWELLSKPRGLRDT